MGYPVRVTMFLVALLGLIVALCSVRFSAAGEKPVGTENIAAIERARKTVRMLDDVYKLAVVLITDKYVQDKKSFPAGRAAVAWFKAISQKGWHEVRIIDATGEPYNDANVARDEFDREGIKQLKAGKAYYEQVERKEGKAYLRAITPIPVVMDKCMMCHENYKLAKKNEPVGALSYRMPVE